MKKAVWSGLIAAAVLLVSSAASAQTQVNGLINVTANVNAKAKLTLGTGAITFADAVSGRSPRALPSSPSTSTSRRAPLRGALSH